LFDIFFRLCYTVSVERKEIELEEIKKSKISKKNYFATRVTCNQEEEDLRMVHKYYRELVIYRDPQRISREIGMALKIFNEPYLSEILKEIKMTPYRAAMLARRTELLTKSEARARDGGDD
jgi:hypothetical protein